MNALNAISKLYLEDYYDVCVLVVENEIEQKLEKKLTEMEYPFPLYYAHESKLGLAHARNRVFLEAEKLNIDWLCSFDDDDEPDVDWLVRLEQAASELTICKIFMGRVEDKFPERESSTS